MNKVRTRYAPSPTGKMHVGNLRKGIRYQTGSVLQRLSTIEVTPRSMEIIIIATEIIYRTLDKAGLEHDEGPDKDGGFGPYVQSERTAAFTKHK